MYYVVHVLYPQIAEDTENRDNAFALHKSIDHSILGCLNGIIVFDVCKGSLPEKA